MFIRISKKLNNSKSKFIIQSAGGGLTETEESLKENALKLLENRTITSEDPRFEKTVEYAIQNMEKTNILGNILDLFHTGILKDINPELRNKIIEYGWKNDSKDDLEKSFDAYYILKHNLVSSNTPFFQELIKALRIKEVIPTLREKIITRENNKDVFSKLVTKLFSYDKMYSKNTLKDFLEEGIVSKEDIKEAENLNKEKEKANLKNNLSKLDKFTNGLNKIITKAEQLKEILKNNPSDQKSLRTVDGLDELLEDFLSHISGYNLEALMDEKEK